MGAFSKNRISINLTIMDFDLFGNVGKDRDRLMMEIHLQRFSESWIWDQNLSNNMNGNLVNPRQFVEF